MNLLFDVERIYFQNLCDTVNFLIRRIAQSSFNPSIIINIDARYFGNFGLGELCFFSGIPKSLSQIFVDYFILVGRHIWIITNPLQKIQRDMAYFYCTGFDDSRTSSNCLSHSSLPKSSINFEFTRIHFSLLTIISCSVTREGAMLIA